MSTIFDLIDKVEQTTENKNTLEFLLKSREKSEKQKKSKNKTKSAKSKNKSSKEENKSSIKQANYSKLLKLITTESKGDTADSDSNTSKVSLEPFNSDLEFLYDIGQEYKIDSITHVGKKVAKYKTKVQTKGAGILDKTEWINLVEKEANRLNEFFIIQELKNFHLNSIKNLDDSTAHSLAVEDYSIKIWNDEEWEEYSNFRERLSKAYNYCVV